MAHTALLPPSEVGTLGPGAFGAGATSAPTHDRVQLAPGRRLASRYELIEPIASGGYGKVWRARHVRIGREFAIKVLLDTRRSSQDPEALIEEARRVSRLEHPNIVNMIDVGFVEPGRPFAVMELLVGRPLRAALDGSPISWARARSWTLQALSGLAFAHEAGVVHGDITPNNLFLDSKHSVTKLIDFGLAQSDDTASSEGERRVRGTPAYMSPEQLQGERVGPASDLYSFGCVLFEVLTGAPPHGGTQNEIIVAHLEQQVPRSAFPPGVPSSVVDAVLQCLRKSAERRPSSARQLAEALTTGALSRTRSATRNAVRRHPWATPIACAAAVVATLTGLVGLAGSPPRTPAARLPTVNLPHFAHTTPPPTLTAQLPVLEVAVERPRPTPTPQTRPKAQRPLPVEILHTHPMGAVEAAPPTPEPRPKARGIAHLGGPKNPFASTLPATTSP